MLLFRGSCWNSPYSSKNFQSKLEASSGIICNTVSLVDKHRNHEVLVNLKLRLLSIVKPKKNESMHILYRRSIQIKL